MPALTYRSDGIPTPFDAAVRKGHEARLAGVLRSACPYTGTNTRGFVTYSRTWRTAWLKGWDAAEVQA